MSLHPKIRQLSSSNKFCSPETEELKSRLKYLIFPKGKYLQSRFHALQINVKLSAQEATRNKSQNKPRVYPALWNRTTQSFLWGQNEGSPWVTRGISALSKQESNSSIKHKVYFNFHILCRDHRAYTFWQRNSLKFLSYSEGYRGKNKSWKYPTWHHLSLYKCSPKQKTATEDIYYKSIRKERHCKAKSKIPMLLPPGERAQGEVENHCLALN